MSIPKVKDLKRSAKGIKFKKVFTNKVDKLFKEQVRDDLLEYDITRLSESLLDSYGFIVDYDAENIIEYLRQYGYFVEEGIYPTSRSTYGRDYAEYRLIVSTKEIPDNILAN